jgi:hypothetical protein
MGGRAAVEAMLGQVQLCRAAPCKIGAMPSIAPPGILGLLAWYAEPPSHTMRAEPLCVHGGPVGPHSVVA